MRSCWCGANKLTFFSEKYSECLECGTLVSQQILTDHQLEVKNDDTDFYGKQYWLEHQTKSLGHPDIHERARNDLSERNLYWLKTLLKYYIPPAKVLELGCSHGSFVALLRQAGYDASGVELSPWVVEFGRKVFDVPISVGPIEALDIPSESFDIIIMMDVLEHLPEPTATIAHCMHLLKPDGILLLQTPEFNNRMNYKNLVETNGAFLKMLISDEHLYLFSKESITRLFHHLGADYINFEPAIFSHYDMFFAVSRTPFQINTLEMIESALLETSSRRIVLALLDMDKKTKALQNIIGELSANRDSILSQLQTVTEWLERKPVKLALALSNLFEHFVKKIR